MRTLAKTTTYGLMHLSVAVTVAYVLTGDWRVALGIGIVEPMVQTVAYTLHERFWARRGTPAKAEGRKSGNRRVGPPCAVL